VWGPHCHRYGAQRLDHEDPRPQDRNPTGPTTRTLPVPETNQPTTTLLSETKQVVVGDAPSVGASPDGSRLAGAARGEDNDFDAFIDAFPGDAKAHRSSARKAYEKALTGEPAVTPPALLAQAKAYAAFVTAKHHRFVLYPQKWLSEQGWLNDYKLSASSAGAKNEPDCPAWDRGNWVLGMKLRACEQDEDGGPAGAMIVEGGFHPQRPLLLEEFKEFDIIVEVHGKTVKTPDNVRKCVAKARTEGFSEIDITLKRLNNRTDEWETEYLTVPLPSEDAGPVTEEEWAAASARMRQRLADEQAARVAKRDARLRQRQSRGTVTHPTHGEVEVIGEDDDRPSGFSRSDQVLVRRGGEIFKVPRSDFATRTLASVMRDLFEGNAPDNVLQAELNTLRLLRPVRLSEFEKAIELERRDYCFLKGWNYDEFHQRVLEAKNARRAGTPAPVLVPDGSA
jgi:hypothetical protein